MGVTAMVESTVLQLMLMDSFSTFINFQSVSLTSLVLHVLNTGASCLGRSLVFLVRCPIKFICLIIQGFRWQVNSGEESAFQNPAPGAPGWGFLSSS